MTTSGVSFTLNGAPNWSMTGCNIISNTSANCNGHGGGASASIAVGTVSACTNPRPNAAAWKDVYAADASNITTVCTQTGSVSWSPGSVPNSAYFLTVNKSGYTEYHVCGDLNLSGSGTLATNAVIVVENGSLNVAAYANVTLSKGAIILTGDNQHNHYVTFPNGKGQAATLVVEAPTDSANPWLGVSLFTDPALSLNLNNVWGIIDDDWGPGSTFDFDGVVYMPHTDLTIHGNTQSAGEKCSMLVTNTFLADGSATISFSRSASACAKAGVQALVPASLVQ